MNPMTRRLVGAAVPLTLALGLAACSDGDDDSTGSDPTSQAPTPTASVTDDDGGSAAPTDASTTAAPVVGIAAHLLDASELPVVGGAWRVDETDQGDVDDEYGECQQFPLLDIGATEVIEREFDGDAAEAEQVVAEFADEKTAWRAQQVLLSWRDNCGDFLAETDDDDLVEVGDLKEVTGADRFAGHYTVTTSELDGTEVETEVVVIAQRGTRLSIVVLDVDGAAPAGFGEEAATVALEKL